MGVSHAASKGEENEQHEMLNIAVVGKREGRCGVRGVKEVQSRDEPDEHARTHTQSRKKCATIRVRSAQERR